jgi:hypothetical protein
MYVNLNTELEFSVTAGQGTRSPITTATLGSVTGQLVVPVIDKTWSLSSNTSNVLFVISTSTNPGAVKLAGLLGVATTITASITIFAYNPATTQIISPSLFWHQLASYVTIASIDAGGTPQVDGSVFFNTVYSGTTSLNVFQPITWLQTSQEATKGSISSLLNFNINPLVPYNNVATANIYITNPNIVTYSDITVTSPVYTYTTVTSVQRQIWLS